MNSDESDPVGKLTIQPVRGILKSAKSIDQSQADNHEQFPSASDDCQTSGMTRSESKSQKIPHFDEMNIIATYHPIDKEYGHMKIDEPKTPYAPGENVDEEMDTQGDADELASPGIDPDTLATKLFQSSGTFHLTRRSIDEIALLSPEGEVQRKQFENHRKQHYNEFEMARLHKKEMEDELRALEQEETSGSEGKDKKTTSSSSDSIKPILVHDHSSHHQHQQRVHVSDDLEHQVDDQSLTPEERERKKQFEMKRKKHYNEFHATHSVNKKDEK